MSDLEMSQPRQDSTNCSPFVSDGENLTWNPHYLAQRQGYPLSTVIDADRAWQEFQNRHGDWYDFRQREGEFVYPLHLAGGAVNFFRCLYSIHEDDLRSEAAYYHLCQSYQAIAWNNRLPLQATIMRSCVIPEPSAGNMASLRMLGRQAGWTEAQVAAIPTLLNGMEHARERTQSIAGRWVSHPVYLQELESLQNRYRQLSESCRPPFPLRRPISPISGPNDEVREHQAAEPSLHRFCEELVRFLDRWDLTQLTTWDIAEPRGFLMQTPEAAVRGEYCPRIPIAFPLQVGDGFSAEHRRQHEILAGRRGIDDLNRFEIYRQIWRIDFLKLILQQRYARQRISRRFRMNSLDFMHIYLELDVARIQRYLRWRDRLRNGEIRSLAGIH